MVSKVGKVIQEEFLEKVLGPKCAKSGLGLGLGFSFFSKKWTFFPKLGLALGLGLGLGLAFQGVK